MGEGDKSLREQEQTPCVFLVVLGLQYSTALKLTRGAYTNAR